MVLECLLRPATVLDQLPLNCLQFLQQIGFDGGGLRGRKRRGWRRLLQLQTGRFGELPLRRFQL